jgi:hypothetical protein
MELGDDGTGSDGALLEDVLSLMMCDMSKTCVLEGLSEEPKEEATGADEGVFDGPLTEKALDIVL